MSLIQLTIEEDTLPASDTNLSDLVLPSLSSESVVVSAGASETELNVRGVAERSGAGLGHQWLVASASDPRFASDSAPPSTELSVAFPRSDAQLPTIALQPSPLFIDFGRNVIVRITPEADALIRTAPWPAIQVLFAAVRHWASREPIRAARITAVTDTEDPSWREIAVDVLLDVVNDEDAFALWDALGEALDRAQGKLSPADRDWAAKHIGVELHWGSDPWETDD